MKEERERGTSGYARRVVSLGGLFTTLAANNERKNRPNRSRRVTFQRKRNWRERGPPLIRDDIARVRGIIENLLRTPLITVLRCS